MSYILWLDDMRNPVDNGHVTNILYDGTIIWCTNLTQAKTCIMCNGMPEHMFLDHDLGPHEDTMMFLKWLYDYDCVFTKFPTWDFLTANLVGQKNMQAFLTSWKKSLSM